jgi:hypothetical protein
MSNKLFSERLNQELDEMGVPQRRDERIDVFSKLLKIHRFQAESILNGTVVLEPTLLADLARVLEVKTTWLLGQTNEREN